MKFSSVVRAGFGVLLSRDASIDCLVRQNEKIKIEENVKLC